MIRCALKIKQWNIQYCRHLCVAELSPFALKGFLHCEFADPLGLELTTEDRRRAYYLKNQEVIKAKAQQYRLANQEAIKAKAQQYRLENRENIRANEKQYRSEHHETRKIQQQQYRVRNRDILNARQRQYYSQNQPTIKAKKRQYRVDNLQTIKARDKQYRLRNSEALKAKSKQALLDYRSRIPRSNKCWTTDEQVRQNFDQIAKELHIQNPATSLDWYRASLDQIAQAGGSGFAHRFNTLGEALLVAYPETKWDLQQFTTKNKKSVQRWLRLKLAELLPTGTPIEEEYYFKSPDDPSKTCFFDLFVPDYGLVVEYQGEQHYAQSSTYGWLDIAQARDSTKEELCRATNKTLVNIPYWWDKKPESLAATLNIALPGVFPTSSHNPIPPNPPKPLLPQVFGDLDTKIKLQQVIMQGIDWNAQTTDPIGWIITEKFDGIRGYWDGFSFYSKQGFRLHTPQAFRDLLPPGIPLDGEFWLDYDHLHELGGLITRAQAMCSDKEEDLRQLWEPVRYKIFDAPNHAGTYQERLRFAEECLAASTADPRFSVIPSEICQDRGHLRELLQQIHKKGGEGLMIYHPTEKYRPGRSSVVQKVKLKLDCSTVTFRRTSPKSLGFFCLQDNGVECFIKCCPYDYQHPPVPGSFLVVQHSGYHKKSQKMKFPVLIMNPVGQVSTE